MRITIICPNISGNDLGRAYILAKVLQRKFPVKIIGPMLGENIWEPLAGDKSVEIAFIRPKGKTIGFLETLRLIKMIDGDIIYASKPLFGSYVVGLVAKFLKGKPLVLDIDDWESGLAKEDYLKLSFLRKIKNFLSSFSSHAYYWNTVFLENLVGLADAVTVSNSFLQKKFKGVVVPHGRDPKILNPEDFDRQKLKEQYGVAGKKVVAFIGSPRKYKGLDDLVEAVSRINRQDVLLMIVGITARENDFCVQAKKKLGDAQVLCLSEQPMSKIGEFLALGDIIVIPQRLTWQTMGQMPAKIYDAMAMAKPIVSTRVCDIPETLAGCGSIAEPGNAADLAEKIKVLLDNEKLAAESGAKARDKFLKQYSYDAMAETLWPQFEKLFRPPNESKRIIKRILIRSGFYSGLFELVRQIFVWCGYVPILVYHKVVDQMQTPTGKPACYLIGNAVSAEEFTEQMQYLKRKYQVISLEEYVEKKKKKEKLGGYAVVTFDDGLKNSGQDIMKNLGLRSTIFLIGNAFHSVFPGHYACFLIDKTAPGVLALQIDGLAHVFDLSRESEKKRMMFFILKTLRTRRIEERSDFLEYLRGKLGVSDTVTCDQMYLTEKEVKELSDQGFSFGAHSIKHTAMNLLGEAEIQEQIEGSYQIVRDITGRKTMAFAIPLGFYDQRVIDQLRNSVFFANVTSDDGLNRPDQDVYRLKRINMNVHDLPEFIFKISGMQMFYEQFFRN